MRRLGGMVAVAALALAGCGSDQEQHGPGEAEHTDEQPGMTTPQVAEDGEEAVGHGEEIGGSHGEAARGPGATGSCLRTASSGVRRRPTASR